MGSGNRAGLAPRDQVDEIMRNMEEGAEKPKPKSVFQSGDKVKVIDGPFSTSTVSWKTVKPESGS